MLGFLIIIALLVLNSNHHTTLTMAAPTADGIVPIPTASLHGKVAIVTGASEIFPS